MNSLSLFNRSDNARIAAGTQRVRTDPCEHDASFEKDRSEHMPLQPEERSERNTRHDPWPAGRQPWRIAAAIGLGYQEP